MLQLLYVQNIMSDINCSDACASVTLMCASFCFLERFEIATPTCKIPI